MHKIILSQKNIILKIKKYFKELEYNEIDTSKSSFCYFNTYSETPGYALANLWINKINKINFFFYVLKNIYSIFFISNYKISNVPKFDYDNIVITWGRLKDFNNKYFIDSFSNSKSNFEKKTLYFVIYLDFQKPKKIPKNVVIFFRNKKKTNFQFFFKKLISVVYLNNFSIKKFFHYFSHQSVFAEDILKNLIKVCDLSNTKKIIMPYEGQPYQNFLFNEVKKKKKIKTIGFIHSMVPALPINFIKRVGSPDVLFLTGKEQLKVFTNYLDWKKNSLKIIPSPRIKRKIDKKKINSIFFPIKIHNKQLISQALEEFILSKKDYYFRNITSKKHPSSFNDKDQDDLSNSINQILFRNKKKFSKKSKIIINFFVGPTSAFIQYLENNIKCIHITNNPIFDIYSFGLWKKVIPKKINKYVYIYTLTKKNRMLIFNNKNQNYSLKNII